MIVSGIVLYAGITAAVESVKKIIEPQTPQYSTTSLIIIAVAVLVKIALGRYVKGQGLKVNSGALVASGADALFDAVLSASVLACALIFTFTGYSLEAYVGALISVFIIKDGIEMMVEMVNEILGIRADKEKTSRIKKLLTEEPEVRGAYDLIMYNYGPEKDFVSVHLELPDSMTAREIDQLTRRLERKVYRKTGVILAGVGLYSYNTSDDEASVIQKKVHDLVTSYNWCVQMHGFYVDLEQKEMSFDVVLSFDIEAKAGVATIHSELQKLYPDYSIEIAPDVDVSD